VKTIDFVILAIYAVAIFGLAQWVSRDKGGKQKDSTDYFLAGKALPWWAIGASLIAANISAEQIIGMSGSGYALGLAIASYEWMAALTLLIVGKFFLPIFLKNNISTMPQFLEQRYGPSVRNVMAVFWLILYVFVNLTSILWLGSIAIHTVTGIDQMTALVIIGVFALAYQLWGGLKAVALTDIVQVALLITGGLIIVFLSLNKIGHGDLLAGFNQLTTQFPEKFDMILSRDNPHYKDLPGLSVLFGGLWVMNVSYWGFNQYIIQRALGAKDIAEAQKGIALAAYLKLLMPVIVVLPGIAALVLVPGLAKPDQAYPEMMKLLPPGVLGLVFAALVAAIVASLAAKINSIATIFTLDIYAKVKTGSTEQPPGHRRPHHRRRRGDRRHRHGQAAAGQGRAGLPVHPGFHRLLHPGHRGDLHAGPVLEARHHRLGPGRRDRRRGPVGRLLRRRQAGRVRDPVHEPRGPGVPADPGGGGHRLAGRAAEERGQCRVAGGGQLQDHQRLQHRRPGRDRDPGRPLRHLVVSSTAPAARVAVAAAFDAARAQA
jgi:SSS family solute:Na+ symporter